MGTVEFEKQVDEYFNRCDKIGYESKNKAKKARKDMYLRKNRKLRIYECEKCGPAGRPKYHLTSRV